MKPAFFQLTQRMWGEQSLLDPKLITVRTYQYTSGGGARNLITWAMAAKAIGFNRLHVMVDSGVVNQKVRGQIREAARVCNASLPGITITVF